MSLPADGRGPARGALLPEAAGAGPTYSAAFATLPGAWSKRSVRAAQCPRRGWQAGRFFPSGGGSAFCPSGSPHPTPPHTQKKTLQQKATRLARPLPPWTSRQQKPLVDSGRQGRGSVQSPLLGPQEVPGSTPGISDEKNQAASASVFGEQLPSGADNTGLEGPMIQYKAILGVHARKLGRAPGTRQKGGGG